MILTIDPEIEINFQASASQCRVESKTKFPGQLHQDVWVRRRDWPGMKVLKYSLDNCEASSIPSTWLRDTQLSFCLLLPSLKPTWINAINLQLAAHHLCSSPPIPISCSRSRWTFARWIPVTSMGCEVESNNKGYQRRDLFHYLIQYITLGQVGLNSEGWFLSIQM